MPSPDSASKTPSQEPADVRGHLSNNLPADVPENDMKPNYTKLDLSRMRISSIVARENISNLAKNADYDVFYGESSDDDQPLVKRHKVSANSPAKSQRGRKGEKGMFIGLHIDDAELPVYARYYPNGALNARVYREDCSEEVIKRWAVFFASKGQCTMERIKFDEEIFHDDEVDIQALSNGDKKLRIRQYLAANGIHPPQPSNRRPKAEQASAAPCKDLAIAPLVQGAPEASQGSTMLHSTDLHIGFWTKNLSLPVYAYVKTYTSANKRSLCYRLHKVDADEDIREIQSYWRHGATVKFDEVSVKGDFLKDSVSATKAYIKSLLCIDPEEDNNRDSESEDEEQRNDIKSGDCRRSSKRLADQTVIRSDYSFRSLNQRVTLGQVHRSKGRAVSDGGDEEYKSSGILPNGSAALGIVTLGNETSQTGKDAIIRSQRVTIRNQEETIAQLQEQIRRLAQRTGVKKSSVPTSVAVVRTRSIGGHVYELLESGPNAGKYLTKNWRKVFSNGKLYKEWIVLAEIKLNMGITGEGEGSQLGDMEFYQVPDGEHKGMFVQKIGPESVYEFGEDKFIKWTLREEIEEPSRLIL